MGERGESFVPPEAAESPYEDDKQREPVESPEAALLRKKNLLSALIDSRTDRPNDPALREQIAQLEREIPDSERYVAQTDGLMKEFSDAGDAPEKRERQTSIENALTEIAERKKDIEAAAARLNAKASESLNRQADTFVSKSMTIVTEKLGDTPEKLEKNMFDNPELSLDDLRQVDTELAGVLEKLDGLLTKAKALG